MFLRLRRHLGWLPPDNRDQAAQQKQIEDVQEPHVAADAIADRHQSIGMALPPRSPIATVLILQSA
jgi:hypothetical protein